MANVMTLIAACLLITQLGFYQPVRIPHSPEQPLLIHPLDGATGVIDHSRHVNVSDVDGDPVDVTFYGRPVVNQGDDFTIVTLPDTQYYSRDYPPIFYSQTGWIVDNQSTENVAAVLHVGDLVDLKYFAGTVGGCPDGDVCAWDNPSVWGSRRQP